MKIVTLHHVPGADTNVQVVAVGPLSAGGAHSHYQIRGFDTARNTANADDDGYRSSFSMLPVIFQNEKPSEEGLVGITMESLMAVCIDRLAAFQAGPFPCVENETAKTHLEQAMASLQSRTARFVEEDRVKLLNEINEASLGA